MKLAFDQRGSMNPLLIPFILLIVLFLGTLGFGVWAYSTGADYKNNSDQKVAAAVKVAEDKVSSEKDNEFLEREKNPLRDYKSSSVFGNITFNYPKTWSAYSQDDDQELTLLMNPRVVSGNDGSVYALRVMVESQKYAERISQYEGDVASGAVKAKAFRLAKVPGVLGSRFDGQIKDGVQGSIVILPLRDKSLTISTESRDFVGDFDKIILPSFSYSP